MSIPAPIYLDYAASTPLDPRVLAVMMPHLAQGAGANPHARHHAPGMDGWRAVEKARAHIAARIGAAADQIIFTSGATEANNLALKGVAAHLLKTGKTHIITSAVEHKSVLETLNALEGFSVSILPVKPCGMIEAAMIEKAITPQTGLISMQAANNETGTIQPLAEIAATLKGRDILLHTDAAQAIGKIDFNVETAGADFVSLSAHKAYGPQGIGALYARDKSLLAPQNSGGGQEYGLRSGTLPIALCAGMGEAFALVDNARAQHQAWRDDFISALVPLSPVINGHSDPAWNVPSIINLRFPGIDAETLIMALPGLAFGSGAACTSHGNAYSHVIRAMTGHDEAARESIRLSFGRFTTKNELEKTAAQISAAVTEIRKMQEAA